jgi:hypothetical protein
MRPGFHYFALRRDFRHYSAADIAIFSRHIFAAFFVSMPPRHAASAAMPMLYYIFSPFSDYFRFSPLDTH